MTDRITRRHVLRRAGAAGLALAGAGLVPRALPGLGAAPARAAAGCTTLTPDLTEGPYWVDLDLHRSDVTANTADASAQAGAGQAGVPLALTIDVLDASNGCAALNGAHVDIWHANADGLYSDESRQGSSAGNTSGQNFLRGYQVTGVDAAASGAAVDGRVAFNTIWPGWYSGRAIHIHMRVRTYDGSGAVVTNYTTQIFFSDADNDAVIDHAAPYDTRSSSAGQTTDENDSILGANGATNIVSVTGSNAAGYVAAFTIMLETAGATGTTGTGGTTGGSTGSSHLTAHVRPVQVIHGPHRTRRLHARVTVDERVTVRAELRRDGRRLAGTHGHLTAGGHEMRMTIPADVAAGAATLHVRLADASGQTATIARAVHVPRR